MPPSSLFEPRQPSLEVVLFIQLKAINENGKYEDGENYFQESGKRTLLTVINKSTSHLGHARKRLNVMYMATTIRAQT